MALIDIKHLTTIFGPHPAQALAKVQAGMGKAELLASSGHTLGLHDISLSIEQGEIFVIMGLSGSGKSTLVRHINRLIDPTDGQILIDGVDVTGLTVPALIELRRKRLSMVFQRFGLLGHRRVIDNVALGLEIQGVPRPERHARAMRWIERVDLQGFEQQYPSQLSGGMQQRVGLARALCSDTDIILMDEAFSALDPLIRSQLQGELLKLQSELGKTIVFITHDLDEALRIGSRVAVLKDGRLIQVDTPQQVLLQPADDYVAAFVRDVNRARALRVGTAVEPWPQGVPWPALDKAVEESDQLESLLVRLVGRKTPLAVRRGDAIIGQVSMERVREMLAQQD